MARFVCVREWLQRPVAAIGPELVSKPVLGQRISAAWPIAPRRRASFIAHAGVLVFHWLSAPVQAQTVALDSQSEQSAAPSVTIAVLATSRGRHAAEGRQILAAVGLALVDWQAANKVPTATATATPELGRQPAQSGATATVAGRLAEPPRLHVEDDGCDAVRAASAAQRIAALRPAANLVILPICDGAAIAAARVLAPLDAIVISPGARHAELTTQRAGPNVFRLAGRDDAQAGVMAAIVFRDHDFGRIALIHDRTRLNRGLIEATRTALLAAGVRPVAVEGLVAGRPSYTKLVDRMITEQADVLVAGLFPAETAIVTGQLGAAGWRGRILGFDALADPAFPLLAPHGAEGIGVLLKPGAPRVEAAARLASRLAGRLAIPLETVGWEAYSAHAAVTIWAMAASRAASFARDRVAAQLTEGSFDSVLGEVRFMASGDADVRAFELFEWRSGKLRATEADRR